MVTPVCQIAFGIQSSGSLVDVVFNRTEIKAKPWKISFAAEILWKQLFHLCRDVLKELCISSEMLVKKKYMLGGSWSCVRVRISVMYDVYMYVLVREHVRLRVCGRERGREPGA